MKEQRIQLIEKLAREFHGTQADKQGQPYVEHLAAVASAVSDRAKAVAWLHDAIEDCHLSYADAVTLGYLLTADELLALTAITRRRQENYGAYIERLAAAAGDAGEIASEVKIADLRHNLSRLTPELERLRGRYERALERLTRERERAPR